MPTSDPDPYRAFNFTVEIQGLVLGGFTEISGLSMTTGTETVQQGGLNTQFKIPAITSYGDIVLKYGVTDQSGLFQWYTEVTQGKITRKNGTIYLRDSQGKQQRSWNLIKAMPIAWSGSTFNAQTGLVATESVTLIHMGLTAG